jgi:monofunctional biosynthetic peptidoglycan transglycosylase
MREKSYGEIGRIAVGVLLGLVITPVIVILIFSLANPRVTPLMLIRALEGEGVEKTWVPLTQISRNLQRAVLVSEDAKFCSHSGFDWEAIDKAIDRYNDKKKRAVGASTVSMQTAKNLFLWQGRNFVRKGLEAYLTVLLETLLSKDRILELYLNIIEWGPGIYGIEAASQRNFGVSAAKLSPSQAAHLAAILPNPRFWRADRPGPGVQALAGRVMARMNAIALGKHGGCP